MPNTVTSLRFPDLSETSGIRQDIIFDSVDAFLQELGEDSQIVLAPGNMTMGSGGAADSHAWLEKCVNVPHWLFSWDKKRIIRQKLIFTFNNGGQEGNYLYTGWYGEGAEGFGFRFKNTGLYGWVANRVHKTETEILTFEAAEWEKTFLLEATLFPGSRVQFVAIEGELTYTLNITTHLPSGEDLNHCLWGWYLDKANDAYHNLLFSSAYFFQDL